jgi:hypothetical protein
MQLYDTDIWWAEPFFMHSYICFYIASLWWCFTYYSNGRIFIYEDVSLFVYSTPYVRPQEHELCDLAFGLNFWDQMAKCKLPIALSLIFLCCSSVHFCRVACAASIPPFCLKQEALLTSDLLRSVHVRHLCHCDITLTQWCQTFMSLWHNTNSVVSDIYVTVT